MPKLELIYEGQAFSILLPVQSLKLPFIQRLLQQSWGLSNSEISLTYFDADGDQISADTQEDLDVARDTMGLGEDVLAFKVGLREGVKPKLLEQEARQSEVQVCDEPQKMEPDVLHSVEQPQKQEQQLKQFKEQEVKNLPPIFIVHKPNEAIEVSQPPEEKAAVQPDLPIQLIPQVVAPAQVHAIPESHENSLFKDIGERVDVQAVNFAQSLEQALQIEAVQEKKQKQFVEKLSAQPKIEKPLKAIKQKKQKLEPKKQSKPKPIAQPKLEDSILTEQKVKQLIKLELNKILPSFEAELLNKISKIKNKQACLENTCQMCDTILSTPFFFYPKQNAYICHTCELTYQTHETALKIRNPFYFKQMVSVTLSEVRRESIADIEALAQEKIMEEARAVAVSQVKQHFKSELNKIKFRKQVEQKKKKDEAVEAAEKERKKIKQGEEKKKTAQAQEADKKKVEKAPKVPNQQKLVAPQVNPDQ